MPRIATVTVPRWLDRSAAWAWRLLLIGAVAAGAIWLLDRLWLVLVPVVIAILLARILIHPVDALQVAGCAGDWPREPRCSCSW